jgi:hypothetical protein
MSQSAAVSNLMSQISRHTFKSHKIIFIILEKVINKKNDRPVTRVLIF